MLTPTRNCLKIEQCPVTEKPYSRLAYLVGALRGIHDSERTIVTVLTGYFDASGHPNQGEVLVVSGFISTEPRWLQFERRWNDALKSAGISCFHMNEFINRSGEFAGWNQGKRERLLKTLGRIVVDTVIWSFAAVVVLEDWRKANKEYQLAENDFHPYALAGWSCVQRALGWCEDRLYTDPLFIAEHGDKHQDSMLRRVEKDFGVIVGTALKKKQQNKPNETPLVQLQSADFAAWQILNIMRRVQAGTERTAELKKEMEPWLWDMFSDLFVAVPYTHSHFSLLDKHTWYRRALGPSSLVALCEDYDIPKRT